MSKKIYPKIKMMKMIMKYYKKRKINKLGKEENYRKRSLKIRIKAPNKIKKNNN